MPSYRAYCELPAHSKTKKHTDGSCPPLLDRLLDELNGAKHIYFSSFLFNNSRLFNYLENLATEGCKVKVFSLPLNGYGDRKYNMVNSKKKVSAKSAAKPIYKKIYNGIPNFSLCVFPHQYLWYRVRYAGGGLPYSLHAKVVFVDAGRRKKKCIITSCNFATSDPPHSENMLVMENNASATKAFKHFFGTLSSRSIDLAKYNSAYKGPEDDFMFTVSSTNLRKKDLIGGNCFFTAPFYKYAGEGSPHFVSRRITKALGDAKKRVWVCVQHFHDVKSYDHESGSLVRSIAEVKKRNKKLDLKVLKQGPHTGLQDKSRAAIAETYYHYVLNSPIRFNKLVHDKFIIIDDKIVISTANFTPTQFAWDEGRKMDHEFSKGPRTKNDNFSEVNAFAIVKSKKVLNEYEKHFEELWGTASPIDLPF